MTSHHVHNIILEMYRHNTVRNICRRMQVIIKTHCHCHHVFFSCVSLKIAWWLVSCEIVLLYLFAVFLQFDSSVFLFLFSLLAYYISVNKLLLLLYQLNTMKMCPANSIL